MTASPQALPPADAGRHGPSPWLKVLTTAVVGVVALVAARPDGSQLLQPQALAWALVGLPLGVVLVEVSLALTASSPLRAMAGAARLLRRWRALPAGNEPLFWSLLVVLAEEALFRLAAFAWLPATWWAVGLVSTAFTALHLPRIVTRRRPVRVALATFMLSSVLCVIFLATRSFWLAVATHLVYNLVTARLRRALRLATATPLPAATGGATGDEGRS